MSENYFYILSKEMAKWLRTSRGRELWTTVDVQEHLWWNAQMSAVVNVLVYRG